MKNIALLLALVFAAISTSTFGQTERDIETGILSLKQQASAPSSPASGKFKAYVRDGKMRIKSSAGVESTVGTGGGSRLNLLTDASFEDGVTEGSCTTCTASQESTILLATPTNLKALKMAFSASTGDYTVSKTTGSEFLGVQGAVSCWIKTTQSGIRFIARRDGSDLDTSMGLYKDVIADGIARPYEIPVVLGTTSNGYKVKATSSITGDVYVDECHVGPAKLTAETSVVGSWVSFTPTGTWSVNTTYTGRYRQVGQNLEVQYLVSLSGAPTAATLTLDVPAGFTIDTSKLPGVPSTDYQVNLAPDCNIMDNGTAMYDCAAHYSTTTTISLRTWIVNATYPSGTYVNATTPMTFASGDKVTLTVNIPVTQLAGSVSSYSSFNADTDWNTCSFSTLAWQGLGTVTVTESMCMRRGSNLHWRFKGTTGTVTGSEVQILLPTWNGSSISVSSTKVTSRQILGPLARGTTLATDNFFVVSSGGVNYVQVGRDNGSVSSIGSSPQTGSAGFGSSEAFNLNVVIPISGWESSNTIVGSFLDMIGSYGSSSGADLQAVYFGTGTNCSSQCTTGTCTICTQIGTRITSVQFVAGNKYDINGIDGTKYVCGGPTFSGGNFGSLIHDKANSTTSKAQVFSGAAAAGGVASYGSVFCFGKP